MCREKCSLALACIVVFMVPYYIYAETQRRPYSINEFMDSYNEYKRLLGGNFDGRARDEFVRTVVGKRGIAFALTPKVRERIGDRELVSRILHEVKGGRGIGVYVIEFDSSHSPQVGAEFAKAVLVEVENLKPDIKSVLDQKTFPTNARNFNEWKNDKPDVYVIYIAGDVSGEGNNSMITAQIRFRPAKTDKDFPVVEKPFALSAAPDKKAAERVARWFVDAIVETFREEKMP